MEDKITITKLSLAKDIFYEIGIPTSMATKIVDSIFAELIDNLAHDKLVKIPKFGSFKVKQKKPRVGRNLNTGAEVIISARNVVSFTASEILRKVMNAKS